MEIVSTLDKMPAYHYQPVQYLLRAENDFLKMNALIGREVKIEFLNEKYCTECGNNFKNLFRMGFCRDCFFNSPSAGESIIRPELSKAHLGEADRDLTFEKAYQLVSHVVYLANSGGLKVGVTRKKSMMNRWIDQGASEAIVLAETSNRFEAGTIEVALKNHVSDKTVWQRMLSLNEPTIDLIGEKRRLCSLLSNELAVFNCKDDETYKITYPVKAFGQKVKSISLDKIPVFENKLQGIRGQYLVFEGGGALNIRGHSGYRVKISF